MNGIYHMEIICTTMEYATHCYGRAPSSDRVFSTNWRERKTGLGEVYSHHWLPPACPVCECLTDTVCDVGRIFYLFWPPALFLRPPPQPHPNNNSAIKQCFVWNCLVTSTVCSFAPLRFILPPVCDFMLQEPWIVPAHLAANSLYCIKQASSSHHQLLFGFGKAV